MPTFTDADRLEKAKQRRNRADRQLRGIRKKIAEKNRRADAHRKIKLGGVVIAAGAGELDAAELAGALVLYLLSRNDETATSARRRGQVIFERNKARRVDPGAPCAPPVRPPASAGA